MVRAPIIPTRAVSAPRARCPRPCLLACWCFSYVRTTTALRPLPLALCADRCRFVSCNVDREEEQELIATHKWIDPEGLIAKDREKRLAEKAKEQA